MSNNVEKSYVDLDFAINMAFYDIEERFKGNVNTCISFLVGKPGCGKTALIKDECHKRGWNFYTRNIGMMPYEEFSGIPENVRDNNGEIYTKWAKPQIVDDLNKLAESNYTICFFDDWHLSSNAVQSLGFELWSAHTLKGFEISPKVQFICAGNDSSMAGSKSQLSALLNRVSKKYVKLSYEYWKTNFAYKNNIHPLILGFLDHSQNSIYFHMEESTFEPWASPRSWTYLSTKLHLIDKKNLELDSFNLNAEMASYIGIEAASNLQKFYVLYKNINVNEIFNTGKFKIPTDVVLRFIFVHAICFEFIERCNKNKKIENRDAEILSNIITEMFNYYPEIGVQFITNIATKYPKIMTDLINMRYITNTIAQKMLHLTSAMGNLEKKFK